VENALRHKPATSAIEETFENQFIFTSLPGSFLAVRPVELAGLLRGKVTQNRFRSMREYPAAGFSASD
jgi:hypothetical protein